MHARFVAFALLGLAFLSGLAMAQTQPMQGSGPDQPVQPQLPVLTQRAPQQPAEPAAQQQPRPPFVLTPQQEAQTDEVLNRWEKHNATIKTFDCWFKRWIYDVVFGSPTQPKYIDLGEIKYAAPDRGAFNAKLTVKNGAEAPIEPARAERWISDGKSIFEFNATKKQLIEHKLPPELQGKSIADSPLPFMFGAEAKKLKDRYWIRLVTPMDVKNQIWLEAIPRYQQDAANFHRATFIIDISRDMKPFGLEILQPNDKDFTRYQFYDAVVNDPLRLFKSDPFRPFTPLGWQKIVEEAPTAQARQPKENPAR